MMFCWFILGLTAGMRAMTPIAVFCVMAALGSFPALQHTWGVWSANWISAGVFAAMALGEYVGDLLPRTPSRREWFPAISRLVFGGLVGALCATAMVLPTASGALFGAIGAAIGTSAGWWLRTTFARRLGRDWPVGVAESMLALALSVWACTHIEVDADYWNGVENSVSMNMVSRDSLTPWPPAPRAEYPHSR